MTTCNQEQLLLLAANELPEAERIAAEAHVARCDACRRELDGLRQGLGLLNGLPPMEPSGEALRRARDVGRRKIGRYRFISANFVQRYRYAWATAAMLTLLFCWAVANDLSGPSPAQLRELWQQSAVQVIESGALADNLADVHAADAWSQAAGVVVADMSRFDPTSELYDLREGVDVLVNEQEQNRRGGS